MTTNTNYKKLSNATNLEIALHQLNNKILNGKEFSDACWTVACSWNIKYELLQDAYDAQYE